MSNRSDLRAKFFPYKDIFAWRKKWRQQCRNWVWNWTIIYPGVLWITEKHRENNLHSENSIMPLGHGWAWASTPNDAFLFPSKKNTEQYKFCLMANISTVSVSRFLLNARPCPIPHERVSWEKCVYFCIHHFGATMVLCNIRSQQETESASASLVKPLCIYMVRILHVNFSHPQSLLNCYGWVTN